jgi:hypothetical protein
LRLFQSWREARPFNHGEHGGRGKNRKPFGAFSIQVVAGSISSSFPRQAEIRLAVAFAVTLSGSITIVISTNDRNVSPACSARSALDKPPSRGRWLAAKPRAGRIRTVEFQAWIFDE